VLFLVPWWVSVARIPLPMSAGCPPPVCGRGCTTGLSTCPLATGGIADPAGRRNVVGPWRAGYMGVVARRFWTVRSERADQPHTWSESARQEWLDKRLDHSISSCSSPARTTSVSRAAMDPLPLQSCWAWCGAARWPSWAEVVVAHAPRWSASPSHCAVGYGAVFVLPQLLHHALCGPGRLLLVGGLL